MQTITSHRVSDGLNDELAIAAVDNPGQADACHEYIIRESNGTEHDVHFQNGPIKKVGVNGISNESLLAIVEHRLLGFQSGEFACRENALALAKIQEAIMWLHKRTRDRIARGVEGVNVK